MQKLRWVLWVMIGIGALAGIYGAALRYSAESKNRTVELAIDMSELQKLATSEGKPLKTILQRFKEAGVSSVAITEDTLGSLEENRRVEVLPTAINNTTYLIAHQRNFDRIVAALQNRTHLGSQISLPPGIGNTNPMDAGMNIPQTFQSLKSLGVGLDYSLIRAAREAKLGVVGRVMNNSNPTDESISWTLLQLKKQRVTTVIFSGDDVLGYDSQLKTTASALRTHDINYGAVEFTKMKGDSELHRVAADRTIRVHTIPGSEMATATIPDNVQRFSLAARERNIRLLYVRLFLEKSHPLDENARYIEQIVMAVRRGGFTLGFAHPYTEASTPRWANALIGLGLAAALLLLADCFAGILSQPSERVSLLVFVAALLLIPLAVFLPKLAALSAAILFASLAVVQHDLLSPIPYGESPLQTVLQRLLRVLGYTSLGIIVVVGLLTDRVFLVKADAFVGIKAALYLPLLIATLAWAVDLRASSPAELWSRIRLQVQRLARLIYEPILLWQVLACLAALVVLAMLWLRSGNDGAAVVSGFELRFRDILDATLPVRPRFKATLFAALMLGMYFCGRKERLWGVPLFLLGVIGVTDYLNTFCHLHIPLLVSVIRDFLGTLIGVAIGTVAILVWEARGKRISRAGDRA
ncbi:DUF5693 family protein [Armatimonas sp.]|uniref:DUF5693 family protein n=1 Tax=Armatimonas sp. TaxID=1872638 RepID=UPI00286CDE88|nr:DUF5693 family protein [Armatimonas sp.]